MSCLAGVVARMVVVLLPTVTFVARHAFTAPTHLRRLQCFFRIPARAAFGLVVVKVRSSPKILDIMGIHTLLAVVSALPALLTHWCRGTTLSCTS